MPDNERIYLWPPLWVRDVILDAVELQKARILFDDIDAGVTHYTVEMYGIRREFCATVASAGRGRSLVRLEVSGAREEKVACLIRKQFAVYESLMLAFSTG